VLGSNLLPQGNQNENQDKLEQVTVSAKCKSAPDVELQVGLFGDLGVGKLKASLNLFSFNFPLKGATHMTQGAGIGLEHTRLYGVPLGVGLDRESYNGGLSWESSSWSAESEPYNASADTGIGFSFGVGIGVNVSHLENLLNLFISCAN
jgi:hypothetical protein